MDTEDWADVLVSASGSPVRVADFRSRLRDGLSVETVSDPESLDATLAVPGTCCVVLGGGLDGHSPSSLVERVRERVSDLPVVVVPDDVEWEEVIDVAGTPYTRLLPPDPGVTDLAEVVHEAVDAYEERATNRRDSTILESLFDQSPYSMYVKDEEARYLLATDDMPGAGDIVGKTDLEWFGEWEPEQAAETYEDDLCVIDTGEPVIKKEAEHEGRIGEGTMWTETTKLPWYDHDGRIRGLVGVTLDITERKRLEGELERKQGFHRRIAKYVAHDVRNPLNLARAHLELAREDPSGERFDSIADSLERIEAVVEDMEVIVGTDRPTVDADSVPTPFRPVIGDAWATVDPATADLETSVPESTILHADRTPLQELFENLFRNAIEHGGTDVRVRVGLLPDGFYVADDGSGLPDTSDDILAYGVTTGGPGDGLGLAIVDEIARTYGWSVTATDSESGGARFEITDVHCIPHPPDESVDATAVEPEETRDVGDATPPGDAERGEEEGSWVVTGGGEDLLRHTNEHHFLYAEVESPARITCRLTDLGHVHEYTTAGAMIRSGLGECDPFGCIDATAVHGIETLWRPEPDALTKRDPIDEGATLPRWFRLTARNDRVTTSLSSDGEAWTPIDQREVALGDVVYPGVAVCSHDPERAVTAEFEGVRIERLGE